MVIRLGFWLLALLLLFILSYLREVTFLSINAMIAGKTFFYASTAEISWLRNLTTNELQQSKYLLTALFSIFFILLTVFGLKVSFPKSLYFKLASLLYLLVTVIALGLIVYAYTVSNFIEVYPTLRKLIGLIHNPILFILLSSVAVAAKNLSSDHEV